MGVGVDLQPIGSGYNRFTINTNFTAIQEAIGDALSRSGSTPNEMNADIDMNSNDLLNVGNVNTERLLVNGEEFVPSSVTAKGDPGDAATVEVGTVTTGDAGTDVIITNVGTESAVVLDFTIPKGDTGASGPGTGDMVASQNLNDVANKATAFTNIKQAATETATGVVELATNEEAETGTDTTRAVTPAGVAAAITAQVGVVLLEGGSISSGPNWTIDISSYTDYRHFEFIIDNFSSTSSSGTPRIQFGADTSDLTIANSYATIQRTVVTTGDGAAGGGNNSSTGILTGSYGVGNFVGLVFKLLSPLDSSTKTSVIGEITGDYNNTSYHVISQFGGKRNTAKTTGTVRVTWDTGTVQSGATYRVYGWK